MSLEDHTDSILEEEILVLQSIYGDDLKVETNCSLKTTIIEIQLHPATANDVDSQFVYIDMLFELENDGYPDESPNINIKSSRGLSDSSLSELRGTMKTVADSQQGEMVLFDLIESVKELLTNNNMPWHPCSICLNHFHKCDEILKVECYHHFHAFCMRQYLDYNENNVNVNGVSTCPVCRKEIKVNYSSLLYAPEPYNEKNFTDKDMKFDKNWNKYKDVFARQQRNGGIIDLEEEKNKNLLSNIEKAFAAANIKSKEENIEKESGESSKTTSSATNTTSVGRKDTANVELPHKKHNYYKRNYNNNRGRGSYSRQRQLQQYHHHHHPMADKTHFHGKHNPTYAAKDHKFRSTRTNATVNKNNNDRTKKVENNRTRTPENIN